MKGKIVSYVANSSKALGFSLCVYSAYAMSSSCDAQEMRMVHAGCILPRISALTRTISPLSCVSYFTLCNRNDFLQSKLLGVFFDAHAPSQSHGVFSFAFICGAEMEVFCHNTRVSLDVGIVRLFFGFALMMISYIVEWFSR